MRTQAAKALYALLALSCLGSTFCGVIAEIGKPLQQAGNVVNELGSKIPNVANIEPVLDDVNTVKDAAKEVSGKISDLNPIDNIISPAPELDFFHNLISMLSKLMSSVNPNHSEEHKEDEVSATEATEDPIDNSSEISNDSDDDESASEDPVDNSSEIPSDSDADESASEDPVDNSSEIPSDSDADESASEDPVDNSSESNDSDDDNSSELSGDSDADESASEEEDDDSSELSGASDDAESASDEPIDISE